MKSEDPQAIALRVDARGAEAAVSEGGLAKIGAAFRHIFPRRAAKAEIILALGDGIASKLRVGDFKFGPQEAAFLALLLQKELPKLVSQEAILQHAEDLLAAEEEVVRQLPSTESGNAPGQNTSQDWVSRFLSYAEDVSDETMRELYARVAAGEAKHPASFSLRSLEVLRKLDAQALQRFERLVGCVFGDRSLLVHGGTDNAYKDTGLNFVDLLLLSEVGLVNMKDSVLGLRLVSRPGVAAAYAEVPCCGAIFRIRNESKVDSPINVPEWTLTTAGIELARLARPVPQPEFIAALGRQLALVCAAIPGTIVERSTDGKEYSPVQPT